MNLKKCLFLVFVLSFAVSAFADEVVLFDKPVKSIGRYDNFSTSLKFDRNAVVAYANIWASESTTHTVCDGSGPERSCETQDDLSTVLSEDIDVPGLAFVKDDLIYHGNSGNVLCGVLKVSGLFRKTNLFLNGNCSLSTKNYYQGRVEMVQVKFISR